MRDGLTDESGGLATGPLEAENRDERGLSGRRVAADRLAGLGRRALDVEEIVGDLEGEAEIMGIAAQGMALLAPGLAENGAGLAGEGDESAGLEALQRGDGADIEGRIVLRQEVDHLAADHAGGARRLGERGDELAAYRRIAVRVGLSQHLEGIGEQPVAGEDGRRLVELLVAGRPTAAE